jgi:hypothetical protein
LTLALFKVADNGIGFGEVAFVRWLVCGKAILPNPCYLLVGFSAQNFN